MGGIIIRYKTWVSQILTLRNSIKIVKTKVIIICTRTIYRKIFLIKVYIFHKPNIYNQIRLYYIKLKFFLRKKKTKTLNNNESNKTNCIIVFVFYSSIVITEITLEWLIIIFWYKISKHWI